MKCPIDQVNLPAEISPRTKQPKPADCIMFIVWSRALFVLDEFFQSLDCLHSETRVGVGSKIDSCCNELAELLVEWDLLTIARSPRLEPIKSWLYADSIIALNSFIIFMRRKESNTDHATHPQAVDAARIVVKTFLEWSGKITLSPGEQVFNTQ